MTTHSRDKMSPTADSDERLVSPEKPSLGPDSERAVQHAADILNVSLDDLLSVVPRMRLRGQSSAADEQNRFPQWDFTQRAMVELAAKILNISLTDLANMSATLRPAKPQHNLEQAAAITMSHRSNPEPEQSEGDGLNHLTQTMGTSQYLEGNEETRAQSSSRNSSIAIFTPASGSGVDSSAQSGSNLSNEVIITPSASGSWAPVPSPSRTENLLVETGASLSDPQPEIVPDSLDMTILSHDVVGDQNMLLATAGFDVSTDDFGSLDDYLDPMIWESFNEDQDMNFVPSSSSSSLPMPGDFGAPGLSISDSRSPILDAVLSMPCSHTQEVSSLMATLSPILESGGSNRPVFDPGLGHRGLSDDHHPVPIAQQGGFQPRMPPSQRPLQPRHTTAEFRTTTSRVQKPRKPRRNLAEDERKQAMVTRGVGACVRCRFLKRKCVPDVGDPSGECLSCRRMGSPTKNMPCLRKKIEDSSFHAERLQPEQYWSRRWKTWTVQEIQDWDGEDIRIINTTQDIGRATDTYKVRRVVPAEGDSMTRQWLSKASGRRMNHPVTPYAIENMVEAARGILKNCDDHIAEMIEHYTASSDRLIQDTFKMAQKYSVDTNVDMAERRLTRNVLQLWVATRRQSKPSRISSSETLEIEPQLIDPARSDYNQVPVPPLISAQISIFSEVLILRPLRDLVRTGLAKMLEKHKDRYFTIYLCVFILLHSYSLVTQYYHRKAKNLRLHAKYSALRELEALHGSANILLTHFHFCGKGSRPFEDCWSSKDVKDLGLTESQANFLRDTSQHKKRIQREAEGIIASGIFHHDLYFVAQMFDSKWEIPGLTVASCAVDS